MTDCLNQREASSAIFQPLAYLLNASETNLKDIPSNVGRTGPDDHCSLLD